MTIDTHGTLDPHVNKTYQFDEEFLMSSYMYLPSGNVSVSEYRIWTPVTKSYTQDTRIGFGVPLWKVILNLETQEYFLVPISYT